jgi:hypothetical protein
MALPSARTLASPNLATSAARRFALSTPPAHPPNRILDTAYEAIRVAEQHEQLLDTVGGLLEEWTARWQTEFTLPAREVVRGIYYLSSRGMGLEALLADQPDPCRPSSPGTGGRGTSCWPSRASGCGP